MIFRDCVLGVGDVGLLRHLVAVFPHENAHNVTRKGALWGPLALAHAHRFPGGLVLRA